MTHCADTPAIRPSAVPFMPSQQGRWFGIAAFSMALLFAAGCKKVVRPGPAASVPVPELVAPEVLAKGDPDERFKAALQLMKERQSVKAREAFFNLAKDFPEFSGPFADLAILQAQAKQPQLAITNFVKATKLNPQNAVAWNWLGTLYREGGDYPKAEAAYQSALAIKPDYATAHLNLGVLYDAYSRRPQEALNHYREYQRIAGTDRLIVTAWIRELEAQVPVSVPASNVQPTAGAPK